MLLPQPTKEQTPHNLLVEKASFYPAIKLYRRVARFWRRILQRHRGENILIISHSGTNKALMSTILGISPAYYHCLEQSNCGLNLLTLPPGDSPTAKLETMNHPLDYPRLHPITQGWLRLLLTTDSQSIYPLIQDEKIDFTLSQNPESPLPQSPHTLHFPVLQHNFSQVWQQTLQKKSFRQHNELLTGLVIASAQEIATFLAGMLGIGEGVSCHPHTLSSLYFPNSGELPSLQTLNLGLFR
jgi:probable phosphoglycerate mutase